MTTADLNLNLNDLPANFDVRTHNGCITIHNPKTGGHSTLRIVTHKGKKAFAPYLGKRTIQKLTGPDTGSKRCWTDFGFVSEAGVSVFFKKRGTPSSKSEWEALAHLAQNPLGGQLRHGLEYLFEGTCRCCNRALTTPESVKSGIGPVCANRAAKSKKLDAKAILDAK